MIIDCTLRDGGYTNNWAFDPFYVSRLLLAASKAGVEFVEMGYRKPYTPEKYSGVYAQCIEEDMRYAKNLYGGKLLVMVDAKDADVTLFTPASESAIWGVRVATYPHELPKALGLCEWFLKQGYHVFLNPMVTSSMDVLDWELINSWEYKHQLMALYIADSFGSFRMENTREIIKKAQCLGVPLGFHAHDNIGLALANTLIARDMGVRYLDATAGGLGRGAGNVKMEQLLGLVPGFGYNPTSYLELGGEHNGYVLTGLLNRHPYYADELVKKQYMISEFYKIIGGEDCPILFDADFIKNKE